MDNNWEDSGYFSSTRQIKFDKLKIQLVWIQKLCDGLKTLNPQQFEYKNFVTYEANQCGTTCCAAGWMPHLVPESGVKWIKNKSSVLTIDPKPTFVFTEISAVFIDFMFYGRNNIFDPTITYDKFGNGYEANLAQVINRIQYVLDYYSNENNYEPMIITKQ